MKYTIIDYLTENKLKELLTSVYINIQSNVNVPNTKMRWDFLINNNTIVEFDGDSHYCNIDVIRRDTLKDNIAKSLNYNTIRIPYFIQLNNQSFFYYFKKSIDIIQNYPHGFINPKATLPASYCEMGIQRFINEIKLLPKNIILDISNSLYNKLNKYEICYILPNKIHFYFQNINKKDI